MAELTRRRFVTAAALSGAGLLCTPTSNALDRALALTTRRAVATAGTTLQAAAASVSSGPSYTKLAAGPGWPVVLRQDLATASAGRDDRRTPVASFVQFNDLHITDTESPARFEYVHPYISSAHRPQEALGTVATNALVKRVNSVRNGPFTGRPFDFMVTTDDNTDNHEQLELDWFLGVLNGGREVTPNSGDPNRYEGVQASGSPSYRNPGTPLADAYSKKGFPQVPGLLEEATRTFTPTASTSPGTARSATTTTA